MNAMRKTKRLLAGGLMCCALGIFIFSGRAVEGAHYDATAGATSTSSGPVPVTAKLKAVSGSGAKGSFTGTLTGRKGNFMGAIKLPLPNAGSGIIDASSAQAADLVLDLTRQGQLYTECDLLFTGLIKNDSVARFAVVVAKRKDTLQQLAGFCELTVDPFGPALPTPLAGDVLTLKAVTAAGEQVLATAVFRK